MAFCSGPLRLRRRLGALRGPGTRKGREKKKEFFEKCGNEAGMLLKTKG
jgi:hypothetical protein